MRVLLVALPVTTALTRISATVAPMNNQHTVSVITSARRGVNGSPYSFIVDTGGEAISLNTSTARGLFTPADRHRIKLNVYGASGIDREAYLLPGVNLAFGTLSLLNQPVVVLNLRAPSILLGYEIGGILGYRFLGKYRVEFDLEHSVLRLRDL